MSRNNPMAQGPECIVVVCILMLSLSGCDSGTEYAPGYNAKVFQQVSVGQSSEHVSELLGEPIWRVLDTNPVVRRWYARGIVIDSEGGELRSIVDPEGILTVEVGDSFPQIEARETLGAPLKTERLTNHELWFYSIPSQGGNFWKRIVEIDLETKTVVAIDSSFYWD